jgi:predicted nuclease of predicted toxin-antitoxin system
MIRFLLDQGLPRGTVKLLRDSGFQAVHTGDIGLSRAADREILEYALVNKQIIVTLDSDFHTHIAVENASAHR